MSESTVNKTHGLDVQYRTPSYGKSDWIPRIISNINKIAISAIALFALSYIPVAEATGVLYSGCTLGCLVACAAASGGVATPVCIAACASACSPTIP